MCEFSERLVAWLDNELLEGDAAEMERHLAECAQCRGRRDAYRQTSEAFEAYCKACSDAALSIKRGRTAARPARVIYGAAAIAAAAAAFFLLTARMRQSLEPNRMEHSSRASASQPVAITQREPRRDVAVASLTAATQAEKRKRRSYVRDAGANRQIEAPGPEESVDSLPGETTVDVSIPAEAIFPPGAVPAGVGFTADITMASDGSAEQIRLRPRLTEFQRRGNQR